MTNCLHCKQILFRTRAKDINLYNMGVKTAACIKQTTELALVYRTQKDLTTKTVSGYTDNWAKVLATLQVEIRSYT